jgi:hypothetical protein
MELMEGLWKLAGFGLSVIHEFIDQSHTKCSRASDYIAEPENIYDTKADIYSLRIIVEELLIFDSKPYANSQLIFQFFIQWVYFQEIALLGPLFASRQLMQTLPNDVPELIRQCGLYQKWQSQHPLPKEL